MTQIDIQRTHTLPQETAIQAVGRALEDLKAHGVAGRWGGDAPPNGAAVCALSGRGITGSVRVEPGRMHLQINLPMLLRPLAGTIRAQIDARLDQVLGAA